MPTYTASFRGIQPYQDRHAWQAQLLVERDGDFVQYVTVAVSGRALLGSRESEPSATFMSSLARRTLVRVRDALETGHLPLADPSRAFEILMDDSHTVRECMAERAPALDRGDIAWSFEG